ncbi:SDR family NAD(P)-dependent oxidoreductase [Hellea balneolensis]|uniref:SDR family NAD(P)-dependent oxidoreductase n=1 Tax=Hellea balneolensis TaxID=287478 RepID=UPI0004791A5A
MEIQKNVALIIGAGDDTGSAIARAFAREGHHVCVVRRPARLDKLTALAESITAEGGSASPHGVDARDEDAMAALITEIETQIGPIDVAVFNIGANVKFNIADTTPRVFRKVWEMASFAGFLMAHNVAPHMAARGRGTMIFTGATASMRGAAGFSAFAAAKHSLRALAQSCARELGPKGIHVAHTIIDGAIDSNFIREIFPKVDEMREKSLILNPDHIAKNYVQLHHQPRDAWTFELDLRPYGEKW